MALLKGITGDENCRWHAAGRLGPQKGICLMWLQSSMKWVINQSCPPWWASGERWVATSLYPRMLWLPRLSPLAPLPRRRCSQFLHLQKWCEWWAGVVPPAGSDPRSRPRETHLSCTSEREEPVFRRSGLCSSSREVAVCRTPTIYVCTDPP